MHNVQMRRGDWTELYGVGERNVDEMDLRSCARCEHENSGNAAEWRIASIRTRCGYADRVPAVAWVTTLPADTSLVTQTLPPIVDRLPIVIRPRMVAPA